MEKPTASASLEETFLAHLGLLEEVVRFVARRHGLDSAEADDLASRVKLKIIESDYDVLRRFQGKSSLKTYLVVVAQRVFLDARIAESGKWRPSAEARRLGPAAERLETLIARDGLELADAIRVLRTNEGRAETEDELRALAQRLPARPRRRFVGDDAIAALPSHAGTPEDGVEEKEAEAAARRAREALAGALAALPPQDRLVLKMRYSDSLQIAEIASVLRVPARPLYKRLQRLLGSLRSSLVGSGVDGSRVLALLGRPTTDLAAGLSGGENARMRPSKGGDGTS